ncbi:cytochrome P450 [Tricladium varicosporioides]|nr:cytochrome P450 [Hymenoscyphus varicosporioides]
MISILTVAILAVLVATFTQIRNRLRWRALNQWGRENGCGEAAVVPNPGIAGLLVKWKMVATGLKGVDFLEDFIRKRYIDMGTYTFRNFATFDNSSMISTSEPENVQAVLATKFQDFDLPPLRQSVFLPLLGVGLFTAEQHNWSRFRQLVKPQFTREQVSDLECADRHLRTLFKILPEENTEGWIESVDFLPLLYRYTMDVSTEFLLGTSVNSQLAALHAEDSGNNTDFQRSIDFTESITYAMRVMILRLRFPWIFWYFSVDHKKFKKSCDTVKDFTNHYVQIFLNSEHKSVLPEPDQKKKYVLLEELAKEIRDPVELRDQVMHIFLAGRDTTAATLGWTLALLARHPEETAKLRASILEHFGTEKSPKTELTFSSMKACKELTYVLYETLRLFPTVAMNARVALRDTILPTGGGSDGKQPIAVMKGETVGFVPYIMHRRSDIWGGDADEFKPERWEGKKLSWEFIPFSGGPRICLGQQYALNEANFLIVKLLQRYDKIEPVDPEAPMLKAISLVLSPGNGVNIKLHRAA